MPRDVDRRTIVSTSAETTYGTAVANGSANKLYNFGQEWPDDAIEKQFLKVCGGEWSSAATKLAIDRSISASGICYPDTMAYHTRYATGVYSVAGAGDPYTHTGKKIAPPTYALPSATQWWYYEGQTTYFKYTGCQLVSFGVGGSYQGGTNPELTFNALWLSDGKRVEETVGITVPTCVEEDCYRIGDVTPHFGVYGGSDETIDFYGFSFDLNNALEQDPRRNGLYVARAREIGDRDGGWTATLTVIGDPTDSVQDIWQNPTEQYVYFNVSCANPVASRVMTVTALKAVIVDLNEVSLKSVRTNGHQITLRLLEDKTSPTTIANSPLMWSVQSATPTFNV